MDGKMAIFTQSPMPITCVAAPQRAMWRRLNSMNALLHERFFPNSWHRLIDMIMRRDNALEDKRSQT